MFANQFEIIKAEVICNFSAWGKVSYVLRVSYVVSTRVSNSPSACFGQNKVSWKVSRLGYGKCQDWVELGM